MDEALRRAERDASQADPEARARLLIGRLRAGSIDGQRLRAAAYVGDDGARCALRSMRVEPAAPSRWVGPAWRRDPGLEWIRDLARFGHEPPIRAGLLLARRLDGHLDIPAEMSRRAVEVREATIAWLRCPCERHAVTLNTKLIWVQRVERTLPRVQAGCAFGPPPTAGGVDRFFGGAIVEAQRLLGLGPPDLAAQEAARRSRDAAQFAVSVLPGDAREPALDAARADLVAWALGDRDSLLDA